MASIFQNTLLSDWKHIDECRRGIELSFLTFYASSRRNIKDNTKRNKSPCSSPSVDEEMAKITINYPRPEHVTRMKPIEAKPTMGERHRMDGDEQPSASTPKEQETNPASPETDPMAFKEGEGRSVSPTATWTSPPHSGPFLTREKRATFIIVEENL